MMYRPNWVGGYLCKQCRDLKDNLLLRMTPEQWDEVMVGQSQERIYDQAGHQADDESESGTIINIGAVIGEMGNAGQSRRRGIIDLPKVWPRTGQM